MNMRPFRKQSLVLSTLLLMLSGCGVDQVELLNPYTDRTSVEYGERSDKAIREETSTNSKADTARYALETVGSYRAAQAPQPVNPVRQPAEVRLMWIPDHLNKAGDLIPAHYYYLEVLPDRWAVTDAFDLEKQLESGSGAGSGTPWVFKQSKGGRK